MDRIKDRRLLYWLMPVLGTLLGLVYIGRATCDVVYSDYIRLVFSYLPDIYNLRKLLVPDVLTRVPINYLERIINVELFGYSLTLDRVLGVLALGLAGLVLASYCRRRSVGLGWFAILMVVMFSLNKWEMLINGSGWCHFLAFVCFYWHEVVLDRVWTGEEKRWDRVKLCLIPWFTILMTAGPYGASYSAVLLMAYALCWLRMYRRQEPEGMRKQPWLLYMACVLVPMVLYLISNSFVVEEYAGATGRPLGVILRDNPTFPIRFLLKSFAGILVGGEDLTNWMDPQIGILGGGRLVLSNKGCYLLGAFIIGGYLLALWMNLRLRLYRQSLLPLMLLAGGALNHLLVFLSRYIFEKEMYALNSSRYTLQFQVGILGIILTFALAMRQKRGRKPALRLLAAIFCLAIVLGNGYTTRSELLVKAKYRKERFEGMAQKALEIPLMSDEEFAEQAEELADYYEYWNGTDRIRIAFQTLYDNHWNVFRSR